MFSAVPLAALQIAQTRDGLLNAAAHAHLFGSAEAASGALRELLATLERRR